MYNEELMYEDTRGDFVEKEIKRLKGNYSYHFLVLALIVNIVVLWKVEPLIIAFFIIGAALGILSGYKLAFDRIRRK